MLPAILCRSVFVLSVSFPACDGWGVTFLLLVFLRIASLCGVYSLIKLGLWRAGWVGGWRLLAAGNSSRYGPIPFGGWRLVVGGYGGLTLALAAATAYSGHWWFGSGVIRGFSCWGACRCALRCDAEGPLMCIRTLWSRGHSSDVRELIGMPVSDDVLRWCRPIRSGSSIWITLTWSSVVGICWCARVSSQAQPSAGPSAGAILAALQLQHDAGLIMSNCRFSANSWHRVRRAAHYMSAMGLWRPPGTQGAPGPLPTSSCNSCMMCSDCFPLGRGGEGSWCYQLVIGRLIWLICDSLHSGDGVV